MVTLTALADQAGRMVAPGSPSPLRCRCLAGRPGRSAGTKRPPPRGGFDPPRSRSCSSQDRQGERRPRKIWPV